VASPIKHRDKWRIRWVDATGKRCSAVYAAYVEAAHELRQREVEAEEVRRGLRLPTPADHTFDALCDYWLENRATQKRSGNHDRSIIRAHLRPAFGPLLLRHVGVEQVDKFINERGSLNRKTIANHVTLLITMLNLAKDLGWLACVPRIKKPRISASQPFGYLATVEDVQRFLAAALGEGPMVYALYATAVWAGLRAGELACLLWSDINWDTRIICVQRSFNGPTKGGAPRYVPIGNALLSALREWRLKNPLPIVFPNDAGRCLGESERSEGTRSQRPRSQRTR
jgi:integrase